MPQYTLPEKVRALKLLDQTQNDFDEVSRVTAIPKSRLRRWAKQRDEIQQAHIAALQTQAAQTMAEVQHHMAKKSLAILDAIDDERIGKAPLNQLASALGVLVDRFLKLDDLTSTSDQKEKVIRFEFQYPDGTIHDTPPWASQHSGESGPLQGRRLRETLRQDGNGQDESELSRHHAASTDVVARTHIPDGEPGLARFEDDDDERDWYHD